MPAEGLRRLIGSLSERVLLCSAEGGVVHTNPAVQQVLKAEPEARALLHAVTRAVRGLGRLRRTFGPDGPAAGRTADRGSSNGERHVEVATARGRYAIRLLDLEDELSPGIRVLVMLEPLFEEPFSDHELRSAYHLTTREVHIARYLAEGLPNDAIARALAISPHTVRRHTERVLRKMGVASRSAVRGKVNRMPTHSPVTARA